MAGVPVRASHVGVPLHAGRLGWSCSEAYDAGHEPLPQDARPFNPRWTCSRTRGGDGFQGLGEMGSGYDAGDREVADVDRPSASSVGRTTSRTVTFLSDGIAPFVRELQHG